MSKEGSTATIVRGKTATTHEDEDNNNDDDHIDDDDCILDDMSRPQDVVCNRDSSSVVSGISNPEFMDDDDSSPIDIPDVIHEALEYDSASQGTGKSPTTSSNAKPPPAVTALDAAGFMSPGKPKKKLKKKKPMAVPIDAEGLAGMTAASTGVAQKVTKTFTPPSLPEEAEAEDRSTRSLKIRVIKKVKSPEAGPVPAQPVPTSETAAGSSTATPPPVEMDANNDDLDEKSPKSGKKARSVSSSVSSESTAGDDNTKEQPPVKIGPIRKVLKRINSLTNMSHAGGPNSTDDNDATEEQQRTIRSGGKKPMKVKSFTKSNSSHSEDDTNIVDGPSLKRGTRERARSREPAPRDRSRDPTSRARSKDPTPRAGSRDPAPRAQSKDPAPRARSKDPAPRSRSKDPAPRDRSREPTTRSRSKEPALRARSRDPTSRARSREPKLRDRGAIDGGSSTQSRNTSSYTPASSRDPAKLLEENEVLLEETAILRRQLNEVTAALNKAKSDTEELAKENEELKGVQREAMELKREIEDCEVAMAEKDAMIKQLSETVDSQLDKVEYLELKLQRAEEEFCKMEDEMKEMEEEVERLRDQHDASDDESSANDSRDGNAGEHRQVNDAKKDLDLRYLNIVERENELEEREKALLEKEDDLREKERKINKTSEAHILRHSGRGEDRGVRHEESGLKQALDAKLDEVVILKRTISQLRDENSALDKRLTSSNNQSDHALQVNIDELRARLLDVEAENAQLVEDNEHLLELESVRAANERQAQDRRDDEARIMQLGINKQLQEFDTENRELRKSVEDLKYQIADLKDQKSRLTQRVEKKQKGETNDDEYTWELEVEIADLREKIVEQEEHSRRQKEEIARVFVENEEIKQELQERDIELRDLESQLSESKETSMKKMAKKDETISFMQTEMMRIMLEKQQTDRCLREKKLDEAESRLMTTIHQRGVDEEAEMAKLQAMNDQLRLLDEENRRLEEELKETQYKIQLRQKEHQSIVLELQEELSDAKWELGARKEGADYITLLKDRKDRKRELDKARKALKEAEERMSDLERANVEYESNKQELEKEIEQLNKNVVSLDSGEYVSGLKRQIKSLKQHNMALERKIEVDEKNAEDKLRLREAKLKILEHELEKLKNPTQVAVRNIFSGFGRRSFEDDNALMRTLPKGEDEGNGGNRQTAAATIPPKLI